MFTQRTFSREWINRQLDTTRARDATNLGKCILSLELVGRLVQGGLNFVFKGGTCLVLHLDPIRRLSIDVDMPALSQSNELKRANE